jgi:hypothetical protein
MSPEPEKAAAPKSETAAAPAPVPEPFFAGKPARKGPPPSGPGEPYTPMPDLSRPARPRWLYALAAFLLALAAATGMLFMRGRAAAPAPLQPAPITAPSAPAPQAGN